ncbi:GNAT family N-acetyltransferase [Plantactinospora siamensis]|uniref:GNAT family N-acetyltransferase n=1 Tax=Plantactinospora siamensis TaxID=555372 RepID=A0ABV6P1X1_9ACTN
MVRSTPAEPPAAPLTDGVVAVRPRRAADVDAIAAASGDPETLRWLDDRPMDAEARRTSMARIDEAWRSGRAAPLVIADARTDEPVGIINLQFTDDRTSTVAYSVFPQHRGRGIAPRAVRLVAGWAVAELGLRRLILEADVQNQASVRVAEKCGFRRVGTRAEAAEGGGRTVVAFVLDAAAAAGD